MSFRKNLRTILFFIGSVCAFMFYYSNYSRRQGLNVTRTLRLPAILSRNVYDANFRSGYAVSSPSCKMLDPNPWNESIQKYLKEPRSLICSRLPVLTFVDQLKNLSNVLKINKKALKKYKVRSNHAIKCCYKVIARITQSVDNYTTNADSLYKLSKCTHFTDRVLLPNDVEFVLVNCQSQPKEDKPQGKSVYKDVHPVIPILPKVRIKMKKKQLESSAERLNVVILGIDSVSKLNSRRILPRTLGYLQKNDWVELKGYNKIGENTFPNLMAILSGNPMQELEKICWGNHSQKTDDCPAIWKEYNKKGYISLYAEDAPAISTFNLLRTGFVEKPTDYYMRPFMLAAHELLHSKKLNGLPVCLGPVLVVDHIFNYAKRFFRAFNNCNYFSLLWLNSLTHNDVNVPRALDLSLHRFLNELSAIGTYNNSLILLLSDHGVRFGDIRETFQGYLEERLPFMFVWFPIWFRKKYPDRYRNLLINQNRLTSPYDVHVTIKKILFEEIQEGEGESPPKPVAKACPKCKSLLEVLPPDRTCADASIDINWCLCSEYRNVPVKDESAVLIGRYLYNFIVNQTNILIKKEKIQQLLCSKWKFLKIFKAQEIIPSKTPQQYSLKNFVNEEIKRYKDHETGTSTRFYVIIIELNPGRTKFESTVLMSVNSSSTIPSFGFLEAPKRLDSIYKTSKCVDSILLKHYCYCTIL